MDDNVNTKEITNIIKKITQSPPTTTCEESEQIIRIKPTKKKNLQDYYEHIGHYCWVLLHRVAEEHYTTPQILIETAHQQGFNLWALLVIAIIAEAHDDEDAWYITANTVERVLDTIMLKMNEKHTA